MIQTNLRFNDAFNRGMAVGFPDIKNDLIHFEFRSQVKGIKKWERFAFSTYDVVGYRGVAHFNGIYYEAKIEDLRKLAKEQAHG